MKLTTPDSYFTDPYYQLFLAARANEDFKLDIPQSAFDKANEQLLVMLSTKEDTLKEGQGLLLTMQPDGKDISAVIARILPAIKKKLAQKNLGLALQKDLKDIIFTGKISADQLIWMVIDLKNNNPEASKTFSEVCQSHKMHQEGDGIKTEIIGILEALSLLLLCPGLCTKAGNILPIIWISGCQIYHDGNWIDCALRLEYDDGAINIYKEHPHTKSPKATVPTTSLLYCLATRTGEASNPIV